MMVKIKFRVTRIVFYWESYLWSQNNSIGVGTLNRLRWLKIVTIITPVCNVVTKFVGIVFGAHCIYSRSPTRSPVSCIVSKKDGVFSSNLLLSQIFQKWAKIETISKVNKLRILSVSYVDNWFHTHTQQFVEFCCLHAEDHWSLC